MRLRNSCLITFLKSTEAATGGAEAVTGGVFKKKLFLKISQTSHENRCVTTGGRGGEGAGLPYPFSKIGKKYPNLEKKCPDCGHLWVQFLI